MTQRALLGGLSHVRQMKLGWGSLAIAAGGLLLMAGYNYLLFHTFVELFAVVVAVLMAVTGWHTYPFSRNHFLIYLAGGYLWVGVIDLIHTLAYRGMGVFPDDGGNAATQFWIVGRYLEAMILVTAPLFAARAIDRSVAFGGFGVVAIVLSVAVLSGYFPDAFLPDIGLTRFKVASEYVIIGLLLAALVFIRRRSELLEPPIVTMVVLSIGLTAAAELMFTLYKSVYGIENMVGHLFKLASYWLIFAAIVRTMLTEPFRVLSQSATTYDAVPDAIVVVDREGIVRQANRAAREQADGMPIGRHCHDVFHAADTDPSNCPVCLAIAFGTREQAAFDIQSGDSWCHITLSPIKWLDDSRAGVVHISRDVTTRHQVEEALRYSEQRFRNLVESTGDWVWEVDVEARYTYVSPRVRDVLGHEPEALLGKTPFDLMPPEEAARIRVLFGQSRGRLEPLHALENVNLHRDGRQVVFETNGMPFFDEAGRFAGYRGIDRDVTERKGAEQALARSHEELSSILLSMSDGVFGMDAEGKVTFVNPALELITGWRAEEFIGGRAHGMIHHAGPSGSPHPQESCSIWRTVSEDLPHRNEEDLFWRRDGTSFPVEYSSSPLRDKKGTLLGAVVVFRDVSERHRIEQERRQRREELERMVAERTHELQAVNRELESFSYSVSHDLRAPLRAVNGFSHALIEDYGDRLDESALDYLTRMQNATNRMGQLIDGLLVLSRVIRSELNVEAVDLSFVAGEIAGELGVSHPDRNVRWVIGTGLQTRGDPRLLRLLLQNLMSNALKFTAPRDEAVIEVGQEADSGETVFFVRDNGVGFEMAYASQLFQPFHRLHSADEYEGTGIGLATVQRVVRRHGGRCWAEAEPERGATVFFTLPSADENPAA